MSSRQDPDDLLDNSWVLEGEIDAQISPNQVPKFQNTTVEEEHDAPDSDSSSEPDQERGEATPNSTSGGNSLKSSLQEQRAQSIASSTANLSTSTPTRRSLASTEPELIMPSSQSWISPSPESMSSSHQLHRVSEFYSRTKTGRKMQASVTSNKTENMATSNALTVQKNEQQKPLELLSGPSIDHVALLRQTLTSFLLSSASTAVEMLRPLALIICTLWITAVMCQLYLPVALLRPLLPMCRIPGVSSLNLSFCAVALPLGQPDFGELMKVQSSFEDVLSSSLSTTNLPHAMKEGEASIRDLRIVVRHSDLPSRNELLFEFNEFIDTARRVSFDLTRFNSHIGRTVDAVLSINRWTLRVIEGISDETGSYGSVSRFLQNTIFAPFQAAQISENLLLDQYLRHTEKVEEEIRRLILEAQGLLIILQSLDDQLDTIQSISAREGISVKSSRDELLAQLWTRLGGNWASKKKLEEQTRLLKLVDAYRRTAWDHVSQTILKLQAISAGLEDLREQVAAPQVVGRGRIPLHVHVEIIQMNLDRLGEQRFGAREWQVENYENLVHSTGSKHTDEEHVYIDGQEK